MPNVLTKPTWPPKPWMPDGTPQTVAEAKRWLNAAGWTIKEKGFRGLRSVVLYRGQQCSWSMASTRLKAFQGTISSIQQYEKVEIGMVAKFGAEYRPYIGPMRIEPETGIPLPGGYADGQGEERACVRRRERACHAR